MKLVSIRDMKAKAYLRPNFQTSIADAVRSWETIANEGDSMISKFPNDFRLYHMANFDSESGHLEVLDPPVDLGSAFDFKRNNSPSL